MAINELKDQANYVYDGLNIEMNPAPMGKRFLALAVDWGILGAFSYIGYFIFVIFIGIFVTAAPSMSETGKSIAGLSFLGMIVLFMVGALFATHAYFIYYESKRGQTPGKRLFGLRVVTLDGSPLTFQKCLYRELMRYIDFWLLIPGPLCMALTKRKQRLGDLISGTAVTYSKQEAEEEQYIYISQVDYNSLASVCPIDSQILNLEIANEYLIFAREIFLKNSLKPQLTSQKEPWEQRIRQKFLPKGHEELGLNGHTVLLYFAEHCYQYINLQNSNKREEEKWKHAS